MSWLLTATWHLSHPFGLSSTLGNDCMRLFIVLIENNNNSKWENSQYYPWIGSAPTILFTCPMSPETLVYSNRARSLHSSVSISTAHLLPPIYSLLLVPLALCHIDLSRRYSLSLSLSTPHPTISLHRFTHSPLRTRPSFSGYTSQH